MTTAYSVNTVEDVAEAAQKAKHLYENHYGHLQLFSQPARDLLETIDHYSTVLSDVVSVLQRYRDSLTRQSSFRSKVEACETLVLSFLDTGDNNETEGHGFARRVGRLLTGKTSSDERDAKCREQKKSLEEDIHKLLGYIVLTALRRTVPVSDAGALPSQTNSVPSPQVRQQIRATLERRSRFGLAVTGQAEIDLGIDVASAFESLFVELIRLRSLYDRNYFPALQQGKPLNTELLRKRLATIWQVLNARVAQIGERDGKAPEFPVDINAVFQSPNTNYTDIIFELSNNAKHLKINQQHRPTRKNTLTQPPPRSIAPSSRRTSAVGSSYGRSPPEFTPPTSPLNPLRSSSVDTTSFFSLPGSMAGSQVADIVLWPNTNRERIVYLHQWHFLLSEHNTRYIRWEGEMPGVELIHHIPDEAFPQVHHSTKSSRRQDGKRARQVFFEDKHHVTYRVSDQVLFDDNIRPTYTFLTTAFQLEFLQTLRKKTRVAWYDAEVIWSDEHVKKNDMGALAGMARLEKFIIWQDKEWPYRHTFSFFSNKTDLEQLEIPISWCTEARKTSEGIKIETGSVPEVISDDEIEAAQILDSEYGHIKLPKWFKVQLSGSGSDARDATKDLVDRFNLARQTDCEITKPKPIQPAHLDATLNSPGEPRQIFELDVTTWELGTEPNDRQEARSPLDAPSTTHGPAQELPAMPVEWGGPVRRRPVPGTSNIPERK